MVMIVAPAQGGTPDKLYAQGLGRFLHDVFSVDLTTATTFGAMALSTFIFDTLDSATRLGRYILQELLGVRSRASAALATLVTVGLPLVLLLSSGSGGFRQFWILFGTSNQLLAALSLLAITAWLGRQGRRTWFAAVPMVFVMAVTVVSLAIQARQVLQSEPLSMPWTNGVVALILIALAAVLVWFGAKAIRQARVPIGLGD